jgi:hypothetical protein
VSVEFAVLYHWHASLSAADDKVRLFRVLSSLAVNSVVLKLSPAVVPFLPLFYLTSISGSFRFLSEFAEYTSISE